MIRKLKRRRRRRPRSPQSMANHVARKMKLHAPLVRLKKCRKCIKGGWSGQYHPTTKTITIAEDPHMKKRLRPALTDHEVSHGFTRQIYCKPKRRHSRLLSRVRGMRKTCTYHGEHDARFYVTLERIHKANGVGPKSAVYIEEASGYRPPASWKRAAKRGRW
jgi:hypothetical protein